MSGPATRPPSRTVEDYLQQVDEARRGECRALCELMQRATGEAPVMWGETMVGFGRYHYRYDSGREGEAFLTGFSARSKELVAYLMAGFEIAPEQLARLGKVKSGKSCLYFKRLADIDVQALEALVRGSVEATRTRYPD